MSGFAALKNAGFLKTDIEALLPRPGSHWHINLDYLFGGFARTTPELMAFITDFECKTNITLEPVYTGKLMYAIYVLLTNYTIKPGKRRIAGHTRGFQG